MYIAVIGACGRTGRLVCEEAISRGHIVIGLSRSQCSILQNKSSEKTTPIDFVIGDSLHYESVDQCVEKADVVISAIGHTKLNEANTQTKSMDNIIKAAKKYHTKKVVSLTGSGVRIEGDHMSLFDKLLNSLLKLIDNRRVNDGINHYLALKESDINWVILRALKLSNGNHLEEYSLTKGGPAKLLVNRRTVAKILVDLAESDFWDKKLPVVSKK